MNDFVQVVVGELQVAPEIIVLVKLCGVMFLLEMLTFGFALLSGVRK